MSPYSSIIDKNIIGIESKGINMWIYDDAMQTLWKLAEDHSMPCGGDGAIQFIYMQRYSVVRVNMLGKSSEGYYCARRDAY